MVIKKIHPPKPPKPIDRIQNIKTVRPIGKTKWSYQRTSGEFIMRFNDLALYGGLASLSAALIMAGCAGADQENDAPGESGPRGSAGDDLRRDRDPASDADDPAGDDDQLRRRR